ncbi:MAG: hypothetical protein IKQ06_05825 [Bacilli bacterium]|nr:hypothetical protein [Bacilli bacterium]
MERKLLKVASILYGITGVLFLEFPVYGVFLILLGIYFYTQSEESNEKLYKNRVINIIFAALGLVNLLGSILVFVVEDNIIKEKRINSHGINAPPKVVYKVDKEAKKIDILLKIGVFMVFVSGILFATTSWSFINDIVKAIALLVFGFLFLGLSLFTEKKLKLYRSSYMYWLLSISLFVLTIVGILYFGIFGDYLTYSGAGSNLAYAITFLTGAAFALTTYYKFPKKYLLYASYGGIIISLGFLFQYLNLNEMTVLAIVSFIVLLTNIIDNRKDKISVFSRIVSYILLAFMFRAGTYGSFDLIAVMLINIFNLNFLIMIDDKKELSVINVILTYIVIIFGASQINMFGDYIYLITALITTIYTLLINGKVIKTNKFTERLNYIIYTIIALTLIISMTDSTQALLIMSIIIALLQLGVNTIIKRGLWRVEKWKAANFIQPLLVLNIIDLVLIYLDEPISGIYEVALMAAVYTLMNLIYRNKLDKKVTHVYLFITLLIGLCFRLHYEDVYACLILILTGLYFFTTTYLEDNEKVWNQIKLNINYLVLLSTIYVPFVYHNILELHIMIPTLIFIVLVFVIAPLLKNEWIKKLSYLYIILPLTVLIENSGTSYPVVAVLESFTGLYILFLLLKFFIKNDIARNIITILGIIFYCFEPFFVEDVICGVYLGIVGIILLIYGVRKDKSLPIFITGIVLTIINILYRLRDVWKQIPFWLYLLAGGLFIIGFVTYREIKRQKEKESNK